MRNDWALGELTIIPHARRDDNLWSDIQAKTKDQIGATLQAMYAALLQ